jgi:hypothetical protein
VDSDGYIGVSIKKAAQWQAGYQPRVQVKQVEPAAVDLAHETFGGMRFLQGPSLAKGRPLYSWSVHSAAVVPVLTALRPHLRIKGAQAENALEVAAINAATGLRRFAVPEVVEGEPMLTIQQTADRLGMSYETVMQAVHKRSIPVVRGPRAGRKPSVFIPESFVDVWRVRGKSPKRTAETTERLHALYERAKELNRVGV